MIVRQARPAWETGRDAIAMVGASIRVPGAASLDEFWRLLVEEKNVIRRAPVGRWSVERFLREGAPSPGFSYSFAGGYLDDPFQFDPIPFGLSSREGAQTDPQQRLLLELVWQAFEDAGVFPAQLNAQNVGVYVGASNVDYQGAAVLDASVIESHFMTGNSLSILANRISHVFDFRGPSVTVDTACSSSLAALQQAMGALETGEIDFAVVAGVNLLLSPIPFIGFAQARMLSPSGLSRPFSAQADGYVRSEGGAVMLLSRRRDAVDRGLRVRSFILGCALNSDGRTPGIALPSSEGQRRLMEGLYGALSIDPEELAFVEAHGTGTQAGDPVEALAIGQALGRRRGKPLPMGSVKSNVGHLESASGMVSLLKASLALEHGLLPRSLFCERLNPDIDFAGLNLQVAQKALPLEGRDGALIAGVCNYGFGGTNAHAVLRSAFPDEAPRSRPVPGAALSGAVGPEPKLMLLCAATPEALKARAAQVCEEIEKGAAPARLAAAYVHQQSLMSHRLATPLGSEEAVLARLRRFVETGSSGPGLSLGVLRGDLAKCAFVFSGNGAQYPDMGRAAYAANAAFREEIDVIDGLFEPLAGWSIAQALQGGIDADRFRRTSVIQPVMFAIQSALAAVLARYGLRPSMALGHSIGEVAAAECCGALTRDEALRIIFHRSHLQEEVRGEGGMLAVALDAPDVVAEIAASGLMLEIAARNSATSITVVGAHDQISAFAHHCRARRIACVDLGLDYPFHSSAMDRLEPLMMEMLGGVEARDGRTPFISTVSGGRVTGAALDACYWWRNLRSPVRFQCAVAAALGQGANLFVEIGPHPILTGPMADIFGLGHGPARAFETFSKNDDAQDDPVLRILAQLVANGAGFDPIALVGARPPRPVSLPSYPFQRDRHVLTSTPEALTAFGGVFESRPRHPLLGARVAEGSPDWRNLLDPLLLPWLADHRVNGAVVAPAAGLIEMALAAGRDLHGGALLALHDFDVLNALVVSAEETREISTRYAEATQTIEIWSRRRFAQDKWLLNARGRLSLLTERPGASLAPPERDELLSDSPDEVYAEAARSGLAYGRCFQLVTRCERDQFTTHVWLDQPVGGLGAFSDIQVLNPLSLDAAFHGLFISRPQRDGETKAHLPVRFHKISVFAQGAKIHQAITLLTHETERYKTVSISFLDAEGALVASVEGAVLRAVWFVRPSLRDRTLQRSMLSLRAPARGGALSALRQGVAPGEMSQAWLLTRAFCLSLAHRVLDEAMAEAGALSLTALREHPLVALSARPWFDVLVSALAGGDLLRTLADGVVLLKELDLPAHETLLSVLMQRCPEANVEIQAASIAACAAGALLRTGAFVTPPASLQGKLESASCALAPTVLALAQALDGLGDHHGRKLRLLAIEPHSTGLARVLAPLVESGRAEVTLALSGAARSDVTGLSDLAWLDLESMSDLRTAPAPFDALVGLALFGPVGKSHALLERAVQLLAPGAPVLLAHPVGEPTLDVLAGVWKDWLVDSSTGLPAAGLATSDRVVNALRRCGVDQLEAVALGGGSGHLVTGVAAVTGRDLDAPPDGGAFVVAEDGAWVGALGFDGARWLRPDEAATRVSQWMAAAPVTETLTILVLPQGRGLEPSEEVAQGIELLRSLLTLTAGSGRPVRIMLVTRSMGANGARPEDAALGGFVRVAINEYPMLDLRLITLAPDVERCDLRQVVANVRGEREIHIERDGVHIPRVARGMSASAPLGADERSRLRFRQSGRVESFEWIRERRPAPKADEVEIEVSASGLNFRDVLVGLGVIDDEILQAGLTNASLGFECSGTIVRMGSEVVGLAIGDQVMGFASGALASHVVAPAWQFTAIPSGVTLEAAATIPVAFATAWHSLIDRAHLRAGDDVLIHGAAGGVGLAAIQIARRAGARVIGTASNEARRAIAATQGADFVFHSRDQGFVEGVRAAVGGVDVVLNSLDGAAMLASFQLLKPFGRFIELGKKDFLDNTHLGLRPFVRNIMYAGVDLDELLKLDRKSAERLMGALVPLFESGELRPLPHQICEAHEIAGAFRAMQSSEHVGKIVIRPPRYGVPDITSAEFTAREGAYLIVGGTSGLGFATAQWLARRGATKLILVSRRGAVEEALQPELERIRQSGVTIEVAALDVVDKQALAALTQRLVRVHGPLRGVVHAAVHLDDGLIAGLEGERLRAVLETKINGALNLESATDDQELDFFVVYSSATTVIGSPGQSAYVAANAFLEGFAHRRRAAGKPALAIGWGALSDVGLIARDRKLGDRLERTTGVVGVRSDEALAHLGRLLALAERVDPIQFYTMIAPGPAAASLALLRSPALGALGLWRDTGAVEDLDNLQSAIKQNSRRQALAILVKALRREAAQILRMEDDHIDPHRPLAESGFDSLMLLELVISVERLTGLQLRMVGAGERTLTSFAIEIVNEMIGAPEADARKGDPALAQASLMAGEHDSPRSPDEAPHASLNRAVIAPVEG